MKIWNNKIISSRCYAAASTYEALAAQALALTDPQSVTLGQDYTYKVLLSTDFTPQRATTFRVDELDRRSEHPEYECIAVAYTHGIAVTRRSRKGDR